MCQHKPLDDNQITFYASKLGILPDRARSYYHRYCNPKLDMDTAIGLALDCNKQTALCTNLDQTNKILKQAMKPYISENYKDSKCLINSILWFTK